MRQLSIAVVALLLAGLPGGCSGDKEQVPSDALGEVSDVVGQDGLEEVQPGEVDEGDTESDDMSGQDVCVPWCGVKDCGPNGCGGSCGECSANEDCVAGLCEVTTPCEKLQECYPEVCDLESGECIPCSSDDQCQGAGDVCDEPSGNCVKCVTDEDCGDGCECQDNECVEMYCPAIPCPEGTVCDLPAGECVECLVNGDCPPNHECIANVCIGPTPCQSSKDCADDEVCNKEAGYCVECITDADCGEGFRCTNEKCEEILFCASDKDCKAYDKVCDKEIGECVDCLSDADCTKDAFCSESVCMPDVCDQAAEWPQCDGTTIVVCNENGSVLTIIEECAAGEFCEDAECKPWVCEPEKTGCDGTVAYECNANGSGYVWQIDCEEDGEACSGGECKEIVCEPGETTCLDMLSLITCPEDGTYVEVTPCGDGEYCDIDECIPWFCTPNSKSCDGHTALTCDEFGTEWGDPVDCEAKELVCANGECVDCDPACGDKDCGPDACGNVCGVCGASEECFSGYCYSMACQGVCTGHSVEAYLCALELCFSEAIVAADFSSPTGDNIGSAWEAVSHFGNPDNDLAPWAGESYGLLASGPATGTAHSVDLPGGGSTSDPFAKDGYMTFDNVEFTVTLSAPDGAKGFSVHYIFLSVEYEEYVGSSFNDKFYIILKGPQTTGGEEIVLNYAACKNPGQYFDFEKDGEKWCYITINNDFGEPCSAVETNISGTGFECGGADSKHGSSTGWLVTTHQINGGEEFDLTFHIHDASDGIYDSEVVLDNFQWHYEEVVNGTVKP